MTPLTIILDGDKAWPDLAPDNPDRPNLIEGRIDSVAALANATANGKPAVALRIELPDGSVVIAQTTLALFATAARGFVARHGDPTA